jgi:signal transduction histidine kinase
MRKCLKTIPMFKKLILRKKLFIYFSVIFAVFTILVLIFQYEREKDFRKKQLENTFDNITEITHKFIKSNKLTDTGNFNLLDSLMTIIPRLNIRITVISPKGVVIYDSEMSDYEEMENHLHRPEVQASTAADFGTNIRKSATTGSSYYYYVKFYPDYYVRTAALYNIEIKDFMQINKLFIIYLIFLFVLLLFIFFFITKNLGETITKLKDFVVRLSSGEDIKESIKFPSDEFGSISSQIIAIYNKLNIAKDEILVEKNKLFSHLNALNEGIAFFSSDKKKILTNNHFIQFLNLISEKSNISADKIFEVKEFKPIIKFIDKQLKSDVLIKDYNLPQIEIDLFKNDKYFNIQCVIFQDKSFEIVIKETTKLEKRKLIKQQMTSNIAHELKTPVATVMGYLETLQNNNVTKEKQKYFIDKAFAQSKRLSELIEDISLLNKIEETKERFIFESVNIDEILTEVNENLKLRLDKKNIRVHIQFANPIILNGNKSLLFSVFYNLFDNAIKYGGENIDINISNYLDDNDNFYFSFSNTGNDIDEKHLSRIFERFYRVDTGRSRKTGGTGLGLAIVKNAIQLHNGEITARNYKNGGVEFLFTMEK